MKVMHIVAIVSVCTALLTVLVLQGIANLCMGCLAHASPRLWADTAVLVLCQEVLVTVLPAPPLPWCFASRYTALPFMRCAVPCVLHTLILPPLPPFLPPPPPLPPPLPSHLLSPLPPAPWPPCSHLASSVPLSTYNIFCTSTPSPPPPLSTQPHFSPSLWLCISHSVALFAV